MVDVDGWHVDGSKSNRGSSNGGGIDYPDDASWYDNSVKFWKNVIPQSNLQIGIENGPSLDQALTFWAEIDDLNIQGQAPVQLHAEQGFNSYLEGRDTVTANFVAGVKFDEYIDTFKNIDNVEVMMGGCSQEEEEDTKPTNINGTSEAFTFEKAVRYNVGSFLLVRRQTPKWYVACARNQSKPSVTWFPEYDSMLSLDGKGHMNFGPEESTVSFLQTTPGTRVYYRKFQRGIVMVNPNAATIVVNVKTLTGRSVASIARSNMQSDNLTFIDIYTFPRFGVLFGKYANATTPPITLSAPTGLKLIP
ncbi:MAG: hypothetical protein ACREA4_04755 [Nitrososphaera sp.]